MAAQTAADAEEPLKNVKYFIHLNVIKPLLDEKSEENDDEKEGDYYDDQDGDNENHLLKNEMCTSKLNNYPKTTTITPITTTTPMVKVTKGE